MADTGTPVTNKVSASIMAQAASAAQRQTTGATTTSTNTAGSGIAPTAVKVGAITYFDVNTAIKALHDDAVARGIPGVPSYFIDTKSYSNIKEAQESIDVYYARIPKSYDVASALQTAHDQAVAKGITGVPDVPKYNSIFTTEKVAQQAINNYLNSIPPTYDTNSAIQSIHDDAVAKGIPGVPAVTTTTKVYTDKAEAQKFIDAYAATIPPTYDVNSAIQTLHDQAIAAGITNVPAATTTTKVYVDEKEAQLVIDAYTKTIPPTYDISTAMTAAHDAAVKAGIPGVPDVPKVAQVYIDSKAAQAAVDAYTKTIPTVYDTTSALQAVHDAAVKQGITNVPDVPVDKTVYTDSAKAQKVIDAYVNKINANVTTSTTKAATVSATTAAAVAATASTATAGVSTYDATSAMKNVRDDLVKQGFANVPAVPTDNKTYTTQESAQAAVNAYVDTINKTTLQNSYDYIRNMVISGNKVGAVAAAAQYGGTTTVDPQKTGGYNFVTKLNDRVTGMLKEAQKANPSLTEYQWRKQMIDTLGANNADAKFFGDRPDVFAWDKSNFALLTALTPNQAYIQPEIIGNNYNTGNKVANVGSSATAGLSTSQAINYLNSADYKAGLKTQGQITNSATGAVVKPATATVKPVVSATAGMTISQAATYLNSSAYKAGLATQGKITPVVTASAITSTKVSTTGHTGQTQLPDGTWKDNAGAKVDHTGQEKLANGTWLDQVVKVGSSGSGGVKKETIIAEHVTATKAEVAAASKNIDKMFTLNSDGTASIKPGAKPTEAERIALDNAQYQLKISTNPVNPSKPSVSVKFGSERVTGSWNPKTGSITNPVARQKVIDAQVQAKADAEQYAKDVKAAQTIGANGEIIDAVQRVGISGVDNSKIITPLFSSSTAKQQFLANTKAEYEAVKSTGRVSLSDLVKSAANDIAAKHALGTVNALGTKVSQDLSGAKLVVQSASDIVSATKVRNDLANREKIVISADMSTEAIANVNAINAQIDQARNEVLARISTPTAKSAAVSKYTSLDTKAVAVQAQIAKQAQAQEPLTDRIISDLESEASSVYNSATKEASNLLGINATGNKLVSAGIVNPQ